jgi:hypothetical protein
VEQQVKPTKSNLPMTSGMRKYVIISLVIVIICSIATGLAVNFYNNYYYDQQLLQANGQAAAAQTQLGNARYDVKFLIENFPTSINCYDLHSKYARSICYTKENVPRDARL